MDNIKEQLARFKAELPIDRDRLDEEVVGQASLYESVGSFVMALKRDARVKKEHLDFVKANMRSKIRGNPGAHGVSKPTVDAIEDASLTSSEYRKAFAEYSDAQYLADVGFVLLDAAGHRKSTLRDAVSLFVHQYYMSSQDMNPQRKAVAKVSEDEVLTHRQQLAAQRSEDTKEDNSSEE